MAYENLAGIYDTLMSDIDYDQWADYLDQLLRQYGCPGEQLLDLGCGTGSISVPLLEKGWQVVGIDSSEEMLMQAEQKSRAKGLMLPLIHQDITALNLNWRADAAIATFDTFNYILEPEALRQAFITIAEALHAGGLLIFDINTPYKLREYLGDNIFTYHSDDVVYLWENDFDDATEICNMYLTFFVLDQRTGLYRKSEEEHQQKLYEPMLLQEWLEQAGFALVAVLNQLSLLPLTEVTEQEKVFFVAKKRVLSNDSNGG